MMSILNRVLTGLFDVLLYPFQKLPPLVGMAVVAAGVSIGILVAFRWTSDQNALRSVKARIHAGILEIRLFKDDVWAILRAQADVLNYSARYLRLSLAPMLWVIVPVSLVLIQLQIRYGYDGLEVGAPAVVTVVLKQGFPSALGFPQGPNLVLESSSGVRVETSMLWIPSLREVNWGVRAMAPGPHELHVRAGDRVYSKVVQVSKLTIVRSPVRPPRQILAQLFHPAEPAVPNDSPIEAIKINYPSATIGFLGWNIPWMVSFFVLTLLFAFALRKPLRVTL